MFADGASTKTGSVAETCDVVILIQLNTILFDGVIHQYPAYAKSL
jgi:hypothetical protein